MPPSTGRASESGTNVSRRPNRPVWTAPQAGRSSRSRYSSFREPSFSPSRSRTVSPRQPSTVSMSCAMSLLSLADSALPALRPPDERDVRYVRSRACPAVPRVLVTNRPWRPPMSTALIIVIVAVVLIALALLAFVARGRRERAHQQGRVEARARDAEADRRGGRAGELDDEARRLSAEAERRHEEADAKRAEARQVESEAEERAQAARGERDAATQLSDRAREVDPDRD